jgi:hypothetical protein
VKYTFDYLKKDTVAKMIGTLSHFIYWSVFGEFNELPIDSYHMEAMFRNILDQVIQIRNDIVQE